MKLKRQSDGGVFCILAMRGRDLFDWIDRRQIDAYVVSFLILYGTVRITDWAMAFANSHPDKSGVDTAAIIAAVMVPWSTLQGAAIKFLFEARQKTFLPKGQS